MRTHSPTISRRRPAATYVLFVLVPLLLSAADARGQMPAARVGDRTTHGGTIQAGSPNVLIGGMPAARLTDFVSCPLVCATIPDVGGTITLGSNSVHVNGLPAARVGSLIAEFGGACGPSLVNLGTPTVLIGD